jgi:activating signal cointegrator complex subunit 2
LRIVIADARIVSEISKFALPPASTVTTKENRAQPFQSILFTSSKKLCKTMTSKSGSLILPPMAAFPTDTWRQHLAPEEWEACLDAWIALADAHLSLSTTEFIRISSKDSSLEVFLSSFVAHSSSTIVGLDSPKLRILRKKSYLLGLRLLESVHVPHDLLQWKFIADIGKLYGRINGKKLAAIAWVRHSSVVETSLSTLKSTLTKTLDAGLKGDLQNTELTLKQLNHLLNISPDAAAFFMAGSDFVDSLISCFKLMNPPLRKVIISTLYLSLMGLTEGESPRFSALIDQLYSLKSAAEAHRSGPTNANDSLVANTVSQTPILKQIQHRLPQSEQGRAKAVLSNLEAYKLPGVSGRPPDKFLRRRVDKGKGRADEGVRLGNAQIHVHRMSQISQIQDLFPDLGSGFIVKLLDEYDENVEQIISHLLEDSLPPSLAGADRSEELSV